MAQRIFSKVSSIPDEELVQSLTRTKDLLEAVWQQNYHDYSYNSLSTQSYDMASPGSSVNRPGVGSGANYRPFNDLAQTSFQFSGTGVRPILKSSHSSYLLPPPELPPPPPPPLLSQSSGMPPPFPNLPGITQCGNLTNLLTLRFYVKSILENLEVQNVPFLQF